MGCKAQGQDTERREGKLERVAEVAPTWPPLGEEIGQMRRMRLITLTDDII